MQMRLFGTLQPVLKIKHLIHLLRDHGKRTVPNIKHATINHYITIA